MKKYILSILSVYLLLSLDLRAQYSDEDISQSRDTIVDCKGYRVRVQILDYKTFRNLENKYAPLTKDSEPIEELERVEELLGSAYILSYEKKSYNSDDGIGYYYTINFVEKKGVYRRMSFLEHEGFQAYFPKEKIFLYFGGHSSDEAFFIESGESAYNPKYSATQKDGKYRLSGLHNGQEGIDGEIQLKDEKTGKYNAIFTMEEFARSLQVSVWDLYFWKTQFWHKNTLYMCAGYGNYLEKEKDWDRNNTFIAFIFLD